MTIDWLANRMEYWRRRYAETGNPINVWDAIRDARGRFTGEKVALPDWVNDYLEHVADKLIFAQRSGLENASSAEIEVREGAWDAAMMEVPVALGFTRKGWNALKQDASDEHKHRIAARHFILTKAEGHTSAAAYEIMQAEDDWKTAEEIKKEKPADIRRLKRHVAAGKAISSLPTGAKAKT